LTGPTSSGWQIVYYGGQYTNSLSLTFTWSQQGSWSVCSVASDSTRGACSPWWGFTWGGPAPVA
jgi:hypothetical protein